MHEPTDVGRQLLCLGSRQQHAVVQRVQKPRFTDPLLLVDQNAMHDRNLTRGAAEAEQRDACPNPKASFSVTGTAFCVGSVVDEFNELST